ncbi:multi-sensor hybrid histidine kinase [Chthoniobacter flavus Ellin428]|uniref:histidine kinase n=1 Tax=Chthoniobacter flavus Ellin428 TaxID=497964 RepID=B4D267_9BACT|nr:response regulator [Chthoniobacter flavus]EDY19307.1 multi-sensor hybrid histidine kinase [Chthoniobacter flavus Ellin428]TCO90561.1 PAS domain S-box-containing protein [Chthoniobacter flavus]
MSDRRYSSSLLSSSHTDLEINHRILIVDDNEAIHNDFRKILGVDASEREFANEEAEVFGHLASITPQQEFEMSFATQGREALELVSGAFADGRRYSLVFMDVRMPPGWDGLETVLKLWEVDPDLQVVICTAHSDKSWQEMMETLGDSERVLILKKPFDTIEVLQLAHALTEKWSLLQVARRNTKELERTVSLRTRELVATNQRLEAEIAGHKAATERIREQAMLLETARDAIIVRDLNDTIVFWNHGAECLYGWTAAEAVGQNVLGLLYGGAPGKDVQAARQAVVEKETWFGELSQKTRDSRTVIVEGRWTLVRDAEGRPKSIMGINSDITEKRQVEAKYLRAQRLDSIGTLAGGIAHDLNNILQPVTMTMDVLRARLPDPSIRSMLDLVINNAERAASLIKQVLSFARGVEGKRVPIPPETLVDDIANIVREVFPKNIQFQLRLAEGARPLLGDSTQLHQVLLNLCVNARDAMPGGGTLTLSVENADIDEYHAATQPDAVAGRYVVLTVADTGCGIPATLRERIYDPFFTTKEQGKGTGLGLATTLSIVRSHGGFISLTSQEGAGTTFRVYVPVSDVIRPMAEAPADDKKRDLRGHGELILVVDDEAPILSVMRQALESFGYRVLAAVDGADGVRVYAKHQNEIKAVITDMVMPVMDGPAMIGVLKKLSPAIKVIATTGMTSNVSIEAIRRLGVERIISKPCAAKAVLVALREVLEEKAVDDLDPSNELPPLSASR